jgi:sugar O-acyltransferase (sialic acid O-acetyltransferase NeuD family)
MSRLLLLGGGGHCVSVADTILRCGKYEEIGIVQNEHRDALFDIIPVIGNDDDLPRLLSAGYTHAFITVGSIGDISIRKYLFNKIKSLGFYIPNIIDPSSIIGKNVVMGTGSFIGKNAIINAGCILGQAVIINTAAVVEHNCTIANYVHISPSATLCGNVMVGVGSHIGAGAVIRQGVKIGEKCIIGMGSVVIKDVPDGTIVAGNPAKKLENKM